MLLIFLLFFIYYPLIFAIHLSAHMWSLLAGSDKRLWERARGSSGLSYAHVESFPSTFGCL